MPRGALVASEWGVDRYGTVGLGKLLLAAPPAAGPRSFQTAQVGGLPEGRLLFWSLSQAADGELYLGTMQGRAPRARLSRSSWKLRWRSPA